MKQKTYLSIDYSEVTEVDSTNNADWRLSSVQVSCPLVSLDMFREFTPSQDSLKYSSHWKHTGNKQGHGEGRDSSRAVSLDRNEEQWMFGRDVPLHSCFPDEWNIYFCLKDHQLLKFHLQHVLPEGSLVWNHQFEPKCWSFKTRPSRVVASI